MTIVFIIFLSLCRLNHGDYHQINVFLTFCIALTYLQFKMLESHFLLVFGGASRSGFALSLKVFFPVWENQFASVFILIRNLPLSFAFQFLEVI